MTEQSKKTDAPQEIADKRKFEDLPPAAQRALQEAKRRRLKMEAEKAQKTKEIGGRGGEDPARYGDWEVKGIAIDF